MSELEPRASATDHEPSLPGLSFGGLTEFLGRSVETDHAHLAPGTRLGDLTIVGLIGEGGMGRVYEALQGMPCRTVAVKVMRPGVLSATAVKRFEFEAQILGRLTHPGIARIYLVGMEPLHGVVVPYFVMEYIEEALSITAYATSHALSTRDRVHLFREACLAVAHGHHKGIIHRDLKPGNILVDATGRPKIIDFGVARTSEGDASLTTAHTGAGHLVGTPHYMCPEQFAGPTPDLDVRADVYALGVVLYELLTGRPPYDLEKRAVHEIARVVMEVEPKSLSTVHGKFHGDLDTIVATCLEKDRDRRYSSAAELEADLGRYLRGEAIAAKPPTLLNALTRLARRHTLAVAAAAAVVVSLIVAVVTVSVFAMRADAARQEAVRQAREAAAERAIATRETSRADAAAATSRQRLYVANLRAIQSCLDTKNLRLARQLHAENVAITGGSELLEMGILAARLDDAAVIVDPQRGPITRVEYAPGSRMLAATTFVPVRFDSRPPRVRTYYDPRTYFDTAMRKETLFFAAGHRHEHYDLLPAGHPGWAALMQPDTERSDLDRNPMATTITPLACSPDGRRLAFPLPDGGLRIINRSNGREASVLAGHRPRLSQAVFDPHGRRIAAIDMVHTLRLWDADSGRLIATWGGDVFVDDFRFSPEGSRLAILATPRNTRRMELRVHEAAEGHRLSVVDLAGDKTLTRESSFVFSPDGERLVTTAHKPVLDVWDADHGTLLGSLRGHSAAVTVAAFSPDGGRLASGAANGHIRLWDMRSRSHERELMGHDGGVTSLAFSDDGEALASGSHDGTMRIWTLATDQPLGILADVRGLAAVAWSPDGGQLAVAALDDGDVEVWHPRTVTRIRTLDGAGGTVSHVAYSPDGTRVAAAFAAANRTGGIRIWDAETGRVMSTCGDHATATKTVDFSPDGSRLLAVGSAGTVMTWDLRADQPLMSVTPIAHNELITSISNAAVFGLGGSLIACRSPHLMNTTTGEPVLKLTAHGAASCRGASADGRVLAIGMASGNVYLQDFETGTRIAELIGHSASVRAVAFSPDSGRVVTGSLDGLARLWDARDGHPIHEFHGHEGSVEAIGFSPDGGRVFTAGTDGTVRIWDARLGQELCLLPGQPDLPTAVDLSPDGRLMVTAAADGTTRIWGLSNAAIAAARHAAAHRGNPENP